MFLIIGCPVYKREWLLPTWFEMIERQDFPLSDIGFVFITGPNDLETLECLHNFSAKHPELRCFDIEEVIERHTVHPDGHRYWNYERYHTMVNLRNHLLARVRCHQPDRFFSLDSDILLENYATISTLVKLTEDHDAVAPLMYMTPDTVNFPSVMSWAPGTGRAFRGEYPIGTLFEVDIIMAAVMMSKPVYENVNYIWCKQGEDLGWSGEANARGYHLYSASYLYCPHIMSTKQFEQYLTEGDNRCSHSKERPLQLQQ